MYAIIAVWIQKISSNIRIEKVRQGKYKFVFLDVRGVKVLQSWHRTRWKNCR